MKVKEMIEKVVAQNPQAETDRQGNIEYYLDGSVIFKITEEELKSIGEDDLFNIDWEKVENSELFIAKCKEALSELNTVDKIVEEVKELISQTEMFEKFSQTYEMSSKEEAEELEAELDSLNIDLQVERVYDTVTINFEKLDSEAKLIKKYDKDWDSREIHEKKALYDYLPNNEDDVRHTFKNSVYIYTEKEFEESLRETNLTEDEIADSIKKADRVNGYIVEVFL